MTDTLERTQALSPNASSPLAGFWCGGFEGADHINAAGMALDMARQSGHWDRLEEDHRRAAQAGIRVVRESIGWRLSEQAGGRIDLERVERIAHSARRHGLQVLWTLMHYGLPGDLNLHDDAMVPRLARFAAAVARAVKSSTRGSRSAQAPVLTPVNEIGFLAWAASQPGLMDLPNSTPGGAADSSAVSGYEVKRRLVRAALAAMQAMREVEPAARFLHVEPVVHVVAPRDRPDLADFARTVRDWQWQAWDLIAGRLEPALGGAPQWLDLVGVNHYHSSQWEVGTEARLDWHGRDPRRIGMGQLLAEAWQRYRRPLLIAETSHVGAGRADWLHDVGHEVRRALAEGVPVQGVCIYPLVDRPDWSEPDRWHRSGLWHVAEPTRGDAALPEPERAVPAPAPAPDAMPRVAEAEALAALRAWQQVLPHALPASADDPRGGPQRRGQLLMFSHLRWAFVRHRARHLAARLAGEWQVSFIEEPLPPAAGDRAWLDVIPQGPNLTVLVPHTPSAGVQPIVAAGLEAPPPPPPAGFDGVHRAAVEDLLRGHFGAAAGEGAERIAWLSTPMAWPLAQRLKSSLGLQAVVYDCSDELSGFLGAPAELPVLESELLAQADRVFAASPSLASARRDAAGARLQLLPNGVDRRRFTRSLSRGWEADEAAWQRQAIGAMPPLARHQPCLGFAGVVDERMDLALLDALAASRPGWRFEIVGPVVKIDPLALPRRPNLHWLDTQPYRLLPALMAHWHVGLLPFVRSEATVHALPLKVLEYLAAGLPVVATQLPDLAPFAPAGVACADSHADFLAACDAALAQSAEAGARHNRNARRLLADCDWDEVANAARAALHQLRSAAASQPLVRGWADRAPASAALIAATAAEAA